MHSLPVVVKLDVLEDIPSRLILVLHAFPSTSSCFRVLKKDSASALPHGLPSFDIDWAIPWIPSIVEKPRTCAGHPGRHRSQG